MPPVGAAIAAGALGGVTLTGTVATGLTLGFSIGNALVAGIGSFALSALSNAFAPKPKAPNFGSFAVKATNRTLQIRQPITAWRLVYGEVRVSGPLIFAAETQNNKYLHLVIVLAAHEVEAINEVWAGDEIIPNDYLDGSGNVTQGRFANRMRIKKHLGGSGQGADSDLVSEVAEWTTAHKGQGRAYIYVRLQKDREVYPTGAPNFSAVVQGRKIFDSRIGASVWTPNSALQAYDYLREDAVGPGVSVSDLDSATVESAANSCEEIVNTSNADAEVSSLDTATDILTLSGDILELQRGDRVEITTTGTAPGGLAVSTNYYVIPFQFGGTPRIKLAASLDDAIDGTAIDITSAGTGTHTVRKTGEPRYFGGGVVETDAPVGDNLREILSGMGGTVVNIGGSWSLYAAVYRAPSVTVDENDLRAPIQIETRASAEERFNSVKGIYTAPFNDWQPADYPVVTNSTYVTNDNNVTRYRDLDFPFCQRGHQAQRLAKIALEQARREITLDWPGKFSAIQFQPTDTLQVDNTRLSFSSKVFEVHAHRTVFEQTEEGAPLLGCDMTLRETDSAVYNWSTAEEGGITPAPRTNFPNPFEVSAPVGIYVDSIKIETQAADNIFRVVLGWQPHQNEFVLQGGHFEIEYKKSSASVWTPTGIKPDGSDTFADVFSGELGTNYDIRVRAVNSLNKPSGWSSLTGFVVGTAGGVGSTEDWGNWVDSVGTTEDWGNWVDSVGTTEDWGGFTS